jgi:hypothetical protein
VSLALPGYAERAVAYTHPARRLYHIQQTLHHVEYESGNLQLASQYNSDDVGTIVDLQSQTSIAFSTSNMMPGSVMFFVNRGLYRGNFDA